jgi:hypothetical protein
MFSAEIAGQSPLVFVAFASTTRADCHAPYAAMSEISLRDPFCLFTGNWHVTVASGMLCGAGKSNYWTGPAECSNCTCHQDCSCSTPPRRLFSKTRDAGTYEGSSGWGCFAHTLILRDGLGDVDLTLRGHDSHGTPPSRLDDMNRSSRRGDRICGSVRHRPVTQPAAAPARSRPPASPASSARRRPSARGPRRPSRSARSCT